MRREDLKNVQAFASALDVPTPLTSVSEQLFRMLEYSSRGSLEPSELLRVFGPPRAGRTAP